MGYHQNLGVGFDGRTVRFLGVDYAALRDRVLKGGSDEAVLEWCFENGRRPTEEEIQIWNSFLRKRGWRDEADGGTASLEKYKAAGGLSHRKDILTYFDFYDAEEGREN